jgi:uncharacterized OsmC-like protein
MNTVAVEMERIVNGVNVDDVEALIGAIQESPDLAISKFRLSNKWIGGGLNQSRVSGFYSGGEEHQHEQEFALDADEPLVLAGTDKGANPVEHLLHALTACLATTLVYHAAVRGIEIRSLEASVEGDLDLRGFLGLSSDVRKGYENIRVSFRVDTDEENMDRLAALSKLSPVFDTTQNGTNVDVSIIQM